MTACSHRYLNDPSGLLCTRTTHEGRGHVYASSSGSDLGEGAHHREPAADDQ